jgi:hypothetical protein
MWNALRVCSGALDVALNLLQVQPAISQEFFGRRRQRLKSFAEKTVAGDDIPPQPLLHGDQAFAIG